MSEFFIQFDGSCSPTNPGPNAGWGYTVVKNGVTFAQNFGQCSGQTVYSNNYAEFQALYEALKEIKNLLQPFDHLIIQGDSNLVVQVMSGRWKSKGDKIYQPAYIRARNKLADIKASGVNVSINWIPREKNEKADELSNAYKSK